MTTNLHTSPTTAEELASQANWLPCITDLRLEAAEAYLSAKSAGANKAHRRIAALRAAGMDEITAEEIARSMRYANRIADEKKAREDFAAKVEAARLPLSAVLTLAMKHCETVRWSHWGSWKTRNGGWSEDRQGSQPFRESPERLANGAAYEHLVTIIGRRGRAVAGRKRGDTTGDVLASTPNDPKLVRLARDIITGRAVNPKRLMSIRDAHARAWAIELCGGWERMSSLLTKIEKTKDGTLFDGSKVGLKSDLLLVTCPTTGRKYMLHVPGPKTWKSIRTVKRALKSVNQIEAAKIVAQS